MALTSGAKKFMVTVVVAGAIGGGAWYMTKKKPVVVEPQATFAPAVQQPVAQDQPAPVAKAEPVEVQKPVEKKKRISKKVGSVPHIKHETSSGSAESSDAKALKDLAGDKL